MTQQYDDSEFLEAVNSITTTHHVAESVGCTPETAHRRLYDLAKEGKVGFQSTPLYRESKREAIVLPKEQVDEPFHTPPEEWPEPLDGRGFTTA